MAHLPCCASVFRLQCSSERFSLHSTYPCIQDVGSSVIQAQKSPYMLIVMGYIAGRS